jgi:hypothetical protein
MKTDSKTTNGWIKTSDGLPAVAGDYIIYREGHAGPLKKLTMKWFDGRRFYPDRNKTITHWRSLPEAP